MLYCFFFFCWPLFFEEVIALYRGCVYKRIIHKLQGIVHSWPSFAVCWSMWILNKWVIVIHSSFAVQNNKNPRMILFLANFILGDGSVSWKTRNFGMILYHDGPYSSWFSFLSFIGSWLDYPNKCTVPVLSCRIHQTCFLLYQPQNLVTKGQDNLETFAFHTRFGFRLFVIRWLAFGLEYFKRLLRAPRSARYHHALSFR